MKDKGIKNNSRHTLAVKPVAILVDGGFFIKRYKKCYRSSINHSSATVAKNMYTIVMSHVDKARLYRILFYACPFLEKKYHNPITKKCNEHDVFFEMHKKGVDIKIGLDIVSLAYKQLVVRIILVSDDTDFVPATKLARREGIDFILDPSGTISILHFTNILMVLNQLTQNLRHKQRLLILRG